MAIIKPCDAHKREALKTDAERAEDVAYTINHAIACSATDFFDPVIQKWTQDWMGRRIHIGCAEDHDHMPHGSWWQSFAGEIAGDFAAVPVTIAFQRFVPGIMENIRHMAEPMVGGIFQKSAEQSAMRWALKNGVAYNSQAYHQRMDDIYNHEMEHLPQAAVWTISSIGLNAATQRALGNTHTLTTIATSKSVASLIVTSTVLGLRALAPRKAREWDQFTTKNVFLPGTRFFSNLFGVQGEVVDRMAAHKQGVQEGTWTGQVQHERVAENTQAAER